MSLWPGHSPSWPRKPKHGGHVGPRISRRVAPSERPYVGSLFVVLDLLGCPPVGDRAGPRNLRDVRLLIRRLTRCYAAVVNSTARGHCVFERAVNGLSPGAPIQEGLLWRGRVCAGSNTRPRRLRIVVGGGRHAWAASSCCSGRRYIGQGCGFSGAAGSRRFGRISCQRRPRPPSHRAARDARTRGEHAHFSGDPA
jgi:hypothetical protein